MGTITFITLGGNNTSPSPSPGPSPSPSTRPGIYPLGWAFYGSYNTSGLNYNTVTSLGAISADISTALNSINKYDIGAIFTATGTFPSYIYNLYECDYNNSLFSSLASNTINPGGSFPNTNLGIPGYNAIVVRIGLNPEGSLPTGTIPATNNIWKDLGVKPLITRTQVPFDYTHGFDQYPLYPFTMADTFVNSQNKDFVSFEILQSSSPETNKFKVFQSTQSNKLVFSYPLTAQQYTGLTATGQTSLSSLTGPTTGLPGYMNGSHIYENCGTISAQFYIEYRPNIILSISSYSTNYFITIFDTLTSNYDIHLCSLTTSGQTTTYTIAANTDSRLSLIWNIGAGLSVMSSFSSTQNLGIAVTAGASPGLVQTTGPYPVSISLSINTSRIHPMNRISTPPVVLQSGYYVNGVNYINITDTTTRTFTSSIGGVSTSGNYVIDNIGKIALVGTSANYSFIYNSSSIGAIYFFDSNGLADIAAAAAPAAALSHVPTQNQSYFSISSQTVAQKRLYIFSDGYIIIYVEVGNPASPIQGRYYYTYTLTGTTLNLTFIPVGTINANINPLTFTYDNTSNPPTLSSGTQSWSYNAS